MLWKKLCSLKEKYPIEFLSGIEFVIMRRETVAFAFPDK